MDKNVIIADSIKYQRMWYAMDIWMQQTMARVPVHKLLLYFVDIVDAAVLPFLAEEFDVLGTKGWQFATTEDEQRSLIRKAVQLHRYKGTLWAVEQAIDQAGLPGAVVTEGTGSGPTGWAVFRITIPVGMMDLSLIEHAVSLVMVYKNQRSVLEGIFYSGLDFTDGVVMGEQDLIIDADETLIGDGMGTLGGFICDGTVYCDGSRNCDNELDTIVITIV